ELPVPAGSRGAAELRPPTLDLVLQVRKTCRTEPEPSRSSAAFDTRRPGTRTPGPFAPNKRSSPAARSAHARRVEKYRPWRLSSAAWPHNCAGLPQIGQIPPEVSPVHTPTLDPFQ